VFPSGAVDYVMQSRGEILACRDDSNETYWQVGLNVALFLMINKFFLPFKSLDETVLTVTNHMKAIEQYFQVALKSFDS